MSLKSFCEYQRFLDLGNDGELSDVGVLSVWLSHCTRVEQVLTWRWELIRKCLYTCICRLGELYLFIWKTCICSFGNCKFAPLFCQFFSSVLDLWKVGCKSSANTKFHRNLGQVLVNANNGNPRCLDTFSVRHEGKIWDNSIFPRAIR